MTVVVIAVRLPIVLVLVFVLRRTTCALYTVQCNKTQYSSITEMPVRTHITLVKLHKQHKLLPKP